MRVLLLLLFTLAKLLGITFSQMGCALPTTMKIEQLLQTIVTSEQANIYTSFKDHHYTCQAVGGRAGLFRSLSIAVRYNETVQGTVNQRVSQIQLKCDSGTGLFVPASDPFEAEAGNESLVFSIPTRRDCRLCTKERYIGIDTDANCVPCSGTCLGMGQRACSNVHGTDCCPYYGANGMCLSNCPTNTVTTNFTCVPVQSSTASNKPVNTAASDTASTEIHFHTSESIPINSDVLISTTHIEYTNTATVAALVSGVLSVIATSLIASCIMWCVVMRGRQKRRDTYPGVHQQETPSTELVDYEVAVLHQRAKDVITTQDNVTYGGEISLQQNVAYEQVHVLQ